MDFNKINEMSNGCNYVDNKLVYTKYRVNESYRKLQQ